MSSKPAFAVTPSLFAFSVFYGGMVCIAGVLGNKQAALGRWRWRPAFSLSCCWS
jgi:hypothetical protein